MSASDAQPGEAPTSPKPEPQGSTEPGAANGKGESRHRLSAAGGHLLAWTGLAVHNAAQLAGFDLPFGGARVRALHHLYDAGQMLAVGALTAGLVLAWERWGPRRAAWAYAACALAALIPSFWLLGTELAGPAQRLTGGSLTIPAWAALVIAVALSIPAAALAGDLLARPYLRWIGAGIGIAGVLSNFIVLRGDYFGAHFYLTWASVTLAGASLRGAELPFAPIPPRVTRALHAGAALFGGALILAWPSNAIFIQLFRLESSILAPVLARLRAGLHDAADAGASAAIPPISAPWFQDRSGAPAVPPSEPSVLPANPIVILITIDAARADLFAGDRYKAALPTLFSLRDQSIHFTQARTPAPQTYVALTTMFTGVYYSRQRWTPRSDRGRGKGWPHAEPSVRFPSLLSEAGVATINLASEYTLLADYGIARGFTEEYHIGDTPRASAIVNKAIERLSAERDGGPIFMHMHFLDAHYPYNRAGTEGEPFDRYVAELGLVDKEIKRLWGAISAFGLKARTSVILSSDHGEAFGEHNTWKHAVSVYDELLRVPLFIYVPGARPRSVDAPVSLIDLGPTVLDFMGLPTPGHFMGQSLAPFVRGQNPELGRPVMADSSRLLQAMIVADGAGLTKIIRDKRRGTFELYDLIADPAEHKNLFREDDPASITRLSALRAFFRAHALREDDYEAPFIR